MTKLLEALGDDSAADLQERFGINKRHIAQFRQDRWGVTSRRELQILMSFAHQYGFSFLTLEPDQIWKTFDVGEAATFLSGAGRGGRRGMRDEDIAAMKLLSGEGIHLDTPENDGEVAPTTMLERNCVLIGSPKYNAASDLALRSLAADTQRTGSFQHIPFKFVWNDWQSVGKESAFCAQSTEDGRVGLEVALPSFPSRSRKRKAQQLGAIDEKAVRVFLSADLESTGKDYGWDFGVFVLCRHPLGTDAEVTTVLLGGLSAYATKEIARELSLGLLFLDFSHVAPGVPLWRILCCPWKRKGRSITAHAGGRRWLNPLDAHDAAELRRLVEDSQRLPPRRATDIDEDQVSD